MTQIQKKIEVRGKDHPGYCKSAETGSMEIGETKSIDGCIRATCNDDGSISLASYVKRNCKSVLIERPDIIN
ncbi:hypothetical protein NQ317_010411 [Molorchus minor]|uniref:Uncharacterized protein n=1 Tax=Molorchus minor TaxID=1323400 RepID=A0ABQ9JJ08_9CUCU|nr:hypothetical protein NQ317_010411 [Molorchus minor]